MNFLKMIPVVSLALLISGCSSSPEDAVHSMFDALADGNIEKLRTNATESTAGLLTMAAMMQCKVDKKDYSDENELASACLENVFGDVDIDSVEITNETETTANATVTSKKDSKTSTQKLKLVKRDGQWKVHMSK